MTLTFYTSVAKGSKLNVRTLFGLIPRFVEVKGEKLVRLFAPPMLIRVNVQYVTNSFSHFFISDTLSSFFFFSNGNIISLWNMFF